LRILVTGGTGFVGRALCRMLAESGNTPRIALRHELPPAGTPAGAGVVVGEIDGATDWTRALQGIECVIHLAAPAGAPVAGEALALYRQVNVAGSERLADEAAAAGARRLVYLSTIKANGESTHARPFTEDDLPQPETDYGRSKLEAEQVLLNKGRDTGLEVVILRPPLVYGPGVRGNFLRLMKLVARRLPLPFGVVRNRRSMIYIGNLVDAIQVCLMPPSAAGQTYLVSDGTDLSTPELVQALARALGVAPQLFPFPPSLLAVGGALLGKAEEAGRLLGSLQIDSSRIRRELGWRPPYTMEEGLAETARWFLGTVKRES